ncbi:cupin domain-containing protein [Aureitalea sp. L0-47]|uniref:cupin domain-containing protein n=1 Tax=Aureitalea sp. L0-47 TaxID=2816962 RepID=UPI002237C3F5|nr:cupin domain-containing protein [Aureitalea sp. L0-47]MCW5520493.1 cupin domain-containing protein [Aureitalea sp. L0-47]
MDKVQEIIKALDLNPHPEGGYYRETYRSEGTIPKEVLGQPFTGDRNYSTGIYFLITSESFSAFHKINQDEMWHFYDGSPMNLHMISPDGEYKVVRIGNALSEGDVPQITVPAGYWFASEVAEENSFSLLGCTVSPGFDFDDFVMPDRAQLITQFPHLEDIITKLTHS